MDNENIDNFLDYNEIVSETLNDKINNIYQLELELGEVGTSWNYAQDTFAKENNTSVDPEDHPLDEEFENLNL